MNIENADLAKAVGKSTLLQIDWKSWKKELPPPGLRVFVVLELEKGYYPVPATFYDETIPASKDGYFPATRWQQVKFDDSQFPDIFWNCKDENKNRLIAWGRLKAIKHLFIPDDDKTSKKDS